MWLQRSSIQIPGDLRTLQITGHCARYILVIEKEAVFSYLCSHHLCDYVPCVLLTGQGYPPLGVRELLQKLMESMRLPVYFLVDHNVSGFLNGMKFHKNACMMGFAQF
eukprot:Sdes_comp9909_c0_seq1m1450